jgi:hypothetical protein
MNKVESYYAHEMYVMAAAKFREAQRMMLRSMREMQQAKDNYTRAMNGEASKIPFDGFTPFTGGFKTQNELCRELDQWQHRNPVFDEIIVKGVMPGMYGCKYRNGATVVEKAEHEF